LIAADDTLADALCPQTDEGAQGDARDEQHQPVLKAEPQRTGSRASGCPAAVVDLGTASVTTSETYGGQSLAMAIPKPT